MPSFRSFAPAVLLTAVAAGVLACGDGTGAAFAPVLLTDTLTLAPPSESDAFPWALDLTPGGAASAVSGGCVGVTGRRPELIEDAVCGWDLAIRSEGGSLAFVPAGAIGLPVRPGIEREPSRSFEDIREAPTGTSSYTIDASVPLVEGGAYIARSRAVGGCRGYFSKLHVLHADADSVRVEAVVSSRCADPRLVPEG